MQEPSSPIASCVLPAREGKSKTSRARNPLALLCRSTLPRFTPPSGLHLRSLLLLSQCNSPHSQPVALMARQQPAAPAGCLQCSKPAFAASCIPAHHCKRRTPALKCFICAALLRCSWNGNSLHSQPVAFSAASLHSHSAASRSSLQAPHISPIGLRYRCSASLFVARQQPASAACCSRCSKHTFAASCTRSA